MQPKPSCPLLRCLPPVLWPYPDPMAVWSATFAVATRADFFAPGFCRRLTADSGDPNRRPA